MAIPYEDVQVIAELDVVQLVHAISMHNTLSVCPLWSREYDALIAARRGNGINVVYINGRA
jgi:hypothetical protein